MFPSSAISVPAARHWAQAVLTNWGLAASDAELALNEMVTNAVVHGAGEIRTNLVLVDAGVRIEVHDRGGVGPIVHRPSSTLHAGGRGLDIIRGVSTAWGWDQADESGTTVWAIIPGTPVRLA
jgi:serine/threonine-protein kinase RsbW